MSKFKPSEFHIQTEKGAVAAQGAPASAAEQEERIVKADAPPEMIVQAYVPSTFKKSGDTSYGAVKAKYGALAVTDTERTARPQKDRRFSLNPLLRDPLSVEEEERRVIEERVRDRIETLKEDTKKQAFDVGYQDGLKQGYEKAFQEFRAEGQTKLAKLETLIQEFESAKDEIYRANERVLVEMIYRIARMVMLKELSADKDYVARIARDLLERVGARENIRIRINPAEAATITSLKEELERSLGTLKNLNIETSNQVERGGCVVETEWNSIDASIETQLKGVYEALVGR